MAPRIAFILDENLLAVVKAVRNMLRASGLGSVTFSTEKGSSSAEPSGPIEYRCSLCEASPDIVSVLVALRSHEE
jgi:hypothetical protein